MMSTRGRAETPSSENSESKVFLPTGPHGAPPHSHLPMGEQLRSATRGACDPVRRSSQIGTQLLVFPLGPQDQVSIQVAHGRVERRTIVAPVILEPTSDDRIEHPRQVFDGFITALWQVPASKCVANGLRCLVRDRRTEIDEELALAILRSSGLKRVPQKIKLLVRVSLLPKIILAIDDLRLLRMEFQSAAL